MPELKTPVIEGMHGKEVMFSDSDPDHYPIPALTKPGSVLMRLELDNLEREAIAHGYDLYVEVLTGRGVQPMRFVVASKEDPPEWLREGY